MTFSKKGKKITIIALTTLLSFSLMTPLNIHADYYEKNRDIQQKGKELRDRVENWDIEKIKSQFPNQIDVEIPKDYQIEPYDINDYDGHIPKLGEFYDYMDKQFEKSLKEYTDLYNTKKQELNDLYTKNKEQILNNQEKAIDNYKDIVLNLEDEYKNKSKEYKDMYNNNKNDLIDDLKNKDEKAAKQYEDNYNKAKEELESIPNDGLKFWTDEVEADFQNGKKQYEEMSKEIEKTKQEVYQEREVILDLVQKTYEEMDKMNNRDIKAHVLNKNQDMINDYMQSKKALLNNGFQPQLGNEVDLSIPSTFKNKNELYNSSIYNVLKNRNKDIYE